jgi:hypothetical protein
MAAMDVQVSYMRLLVGDNSRTAPVYSDATLRDNVRITNPRTADPIKLRIAGVLAFRRYPSDVSGGPFTGPF